PLQQFDQILAGIAAPPHRLFIEPAELALADIGIVALQLLLGGELGSIIRRLLAPLAVLAGAVFPTVEGALRTAPQIDAEASVDLVFRLGALAHRFRFRFRFLLSQWAVRRIRAGTGAYAHSVGKGSNYNRRAGKV